MHSHKPLLAIALTMSAAIVSAATLQVPSQHRRLQLAINAAAPGDTIVLAAGTFDEAYSVGTIQWNGKNLTIKGAGVGKTTLTGNGLERIINASNLTAVSRIEGITFFNGWQAAGGAIFNTDCSLTVANCQFLLNQAANGAAVFNRRGNPTYLNCSFKNNSAMSNGAGMYNENSNPTITGCVFESSLAGVAGGGIYNADSSPRVTNCTFKNLQAWDGAGIATSGGNSTLTNCLFLGNQAFRDGGGVHNSFGGNATATNCTFVNNTALPNFNSGKGGAIYSEDTTGWGTSTATVINSIIWGNTGVMNPAIHGNTVVSFSDVQGLPNSLPDVNGNFAAEPLFVNAVGGDLRLQANSPCRERGNNAMLTSPPFTTFPSWNTFIDLLNCRRLSSAKIDLGSYEFQSLADITSKVSITKLGAFPNAQGTITQNIIVTNNTGTMLFGPISVVFNGLTGYTLSNRTGVTSAVTPFGRPYINVPIPLLAPGGSAIVTLVFAKTGTGTFNYTNQVLDGIGTR